MILDQIFPLKEYHLYELHPVLAMVSKYLESHILNSGYRTATLNQNFGNENYDLAISNYAFSELPAQIQIKYIEKILSRSTKGYLTMNSGRPDSFFAENHLSLETMRNLLPPFDVMPKDPITAPNNYVLVWGHKS